MDFESLIANITVLLPSGEGVRSTDEGSDINVNPNGIDPSPENQLFATAQRDFLPSPVGRGLRSGIPTWYADTVIAMTVLFPPLATEG